MNLPNTLYEIYEILIIPACALLGAYCVWLLIKYRLMETDKR